MEAANETGPRAAAPSEDRWEWVEYIIPLSFLRVLWNGIVPSRFRALVLSGIDGIPAPGYSRPFTFCIGCWLLFFASGQAFPWVFRVVGIGPILTELPTADRRAVAKSLGIDTIVTIADSGRVSLTTGGRRAIDRVHRLTHKRFGLSTPSDIAQYVESAGDSSLAIRVRGYAMRRDERPNPFNETALVFFVVFGLVPGWWVSHKMLASRRRTARETRYVHMYNDSWLVVFALMPLSIATWAGTAFGSRVPQRILTVFTVAGFVTWLLRTPMLFRATHDAPLWRVAVAHVLGLLVAMTMAVVFAFFSAVVTFSIMRAGL